MSTVLALCSAIVFLAISALHFYWAAGGTWWKALAVPTVEGKRTFTPGAGITAVVAIGLLAFALVHISVWRTPAWLPHWVQQSGLFAIGVIFVLRAVGERQYIGFFKKVRHTDFAYYDTRIYSPLCLALGCNAWFLWYSV